MNKACEILVNAPEKTLDDGRRKMPVIVLMTDGEANKSDLKYTDNYFGTERDGSKDNVIDAFITQLSILYTKYKVNQAYNFNGNTKIDGARQALLYTLGFNIGDMALAKEIMNPTKFSHEVMEKYWTDYKNSGGKGININKIRIPFYPETQEMIEYNANKQLNYVDKYFDAVGSAGLTDAFNQIVQEIIIQSKYYPTDNALSSDPDLSGYVEYIDSIPEFMEVKDIKGVFYRSDDGQHYKFTQADFAKISKTDLGDKLHPTELGNRFVYSMVERLSLTNPQEAWVLLDNAYNNKMIYYDEINPDNSKSYFEWYSKLGADGKEICLGKDKTNDATFYNNSYILYGSAQNSDLFFLSTTVRTEISTGKQTVIYQIPASLVPMRSYKVTLNEPGVYEATSARTILEKDQVPARLYYEVGLKDGIYDYNVGNIVADKAPVDSDGNYYFYTNEWDKNNTTKGLTTTHFDPNIANEFYYFVRNTPLHGVVGNNLHYEFKTLKELADYINADAANGFANVKLHYKDYIYKVGDLPQSDSGMIERDNENTKLDIRHYLTKDASGNYQVNETELSKFFTVVKGRVSIKINTPKFELEKDEFTTNNGYAYIGKKAGGLGGNTQTAVNYIYPNVNFQGKHVSIDVNHGNNGLLKIKQANGLYVSKTVKATSGQTIDPNASFNFEVQLTNSDGTPLANYDLRKVVVTSVETTSTVKTDANGKVLVKGACSEILYISICLYASLFFKLLIIYILI